MKLVGAALIFSAITWCGLRASNVLKQRYDFFEKFITALELLKSEIAFSGTDLKSAFENVAQISGADIFAAAAAYSECEGINSAWERAVGIAGLCEKDGQLVALLSSKLGKTDVHGQIRHIEYVMGLLDEVRKSARSNYEKSGGLYRRGGVLLGIFAVLILI